MSHRLTLRVRAQAPALRLQSVRRMRSEAEWERSGEAVLDYLGFSQSEYLDLADHVMQGVS